MEQLILLMSTLDNEDLQQINPDDLEGDGLIGGRMASNNKSRRFHKNTRRKLRFVIGLQGTKENKNREKTKEGEKVGTGSKKEDEIQLTVEKYENSSKSLSKLLDCQIVDKCKTSLGYNAVPPPYTGNFMPPKPDLSFSGLEEFVNEPIVSKPAVKKPVVETSEAKASTDKPKAVRKNNGAPIIEVGCLIVRKKMCLRLRKRRK
ncbi:hypothetical protein Tco_1463664 [Tanacetum coccineum]